MSNTSPCIVCGSETRKVRDWRKTDIIESYSRKFNTSFPDDIPLQNYEILRCKNCTLVFCDPLVPGNDQFYGWLTAQRLYYPKTRWEWHEVKANLANSSTDINILEIGCGDGNFLEFISDIEGVKAIGLDTHGESVEQCHRRGLQALQMDISELRTDQRFDAVCAFHCLEHVSNPVSFMETALGYASGQVFVSVPYSPTTGDVVLHDCLNLPPHHITRWNAASLRRLALELGADVRLASPNDAVGVLRPALYAMCSYFPDLGGVSNLRLLSRVLGNFGKTRALAALICHFLARARIDGRPAGDVVLAAFHLDRS